jgi:hypothetical protein
MHLYIEILDNEDEATADNSRILDEWDRLTNGYVSLSVYMHIYRYIYIYTHVSIYIYMYMHRHPCTYM